MSDVENHLPTMRFVVLTGLSGSGKTTARQALEEFGFFSVDNLPPQLWQETIQLCETRGLTKLAVVTDARTLHFLADFEQVLNNISKRVQPEVVFLEADDEVLIRRYGLTRRNHPMQESTLIADFHEERRVLAPIRALATNTIDTTDLSSRALLERMRTMFGDEKSFSARIFSFGFKHGTPRDADLVLDVRSLPNPFYDEKLKPMSGLDEAVKKYVFTPEATSFYDQIKRFVGSSLEMAQRSGRPNYSVAIGCTGGRHRSVAVVEALARDLSPDWPLKIEHRDIEKSEGGP